MDYKSFNGTKKFEELDHQHLSNIYWYNTVVIGVSPAHLHRFTKSIEDRFGGVYLEYRPHPDFKQEIEFLETLNLLKWNEDKTIAEIWWREKRIGTFETREYQRNKALNYLLSNEIL